MKDFIEQIIHNIAGEVSTKPSDLAYYATDGGVFELQPDVIVFPKDVTDIQALVRESGIHYQKTGTVISLTARGNGTDQGGGPINTGVIVDFTKHMNQILEIGDDYVVVQPGCIYDRLQKELERRGRYIPAYPASVGICTIGGAVANNSAGEKTVKYGATRNYVEAIQIVLADGTATWIYDLSQEELDLKKSQNTLEGAIYREIETLLNEHEHAIYNDHPHVTKESSGYALWNVKKGEKFSLPQLVTGSQGTLCMITSIRLRTIAAPDPHKVTLQVSYYDDIHAVSQAAKQLHDLQPSALEIVDKNLLNLVNVQEPSLLKGLLPEGALPEFVLLAEFDNEDDFERQEKELLAQKITDQFASNSIMKYDPSEKAALWRLRRSAAAVMWTIPGKQKALPIVEDGTVPPHRLDDFLTESYKLFEKYNLKIAVWGHAGDADLHMQPFMDLSDENDRKKVFALTDEFYAMVHSLGGTPAGEHNDSLMRAPYRQMMFGPVLEELFNKTKHIFDAQNLFNPHKKVGVDFNYIKQHLRHEYSIKSLERIPESNATDVVDR